MPVPRGPRARETCLPRQLRRIGAAVLVVSGVLASVPAARGDQAPPAGPASPAWYEAYRQAVAAAELENWDKVVTQIDRALKLNAKSERNVRVYGMWHASYIPYFYLGLAQYHLGRGAEALQNLEKEEAQNVVQHDPVAYLKLRKIADRIQAGGKPADGAAAPPPAAPAAGSPPADNLVEGLQAFFQGEYDRSVGLFQDELKRSTKDDLTLHLYLGMAYAGKASEDSTRRDIWRNLSFMEFKRVHALDPDYTLASGIFSEEMVTLFNEATKKR